MNFLELKKLGGQGFLDAIGNVAEGLLISNLFQGQDGHIFALFERGNALRDRTRRCHRVIQ